MAKPRSLFRNLALLACAGLMLAACGDARTARLRGVQAIPSKLLAEMKTKGMDRSSPVLVRIYKQEAELEVWKKTSSGRFALLKTYPICRWSGQLGPKKNEGDRQVPEGFYTVGPSQLNPNSRYYLSFDVGYPNAVDASLGRSGGDIMVHGSCSSRGCFAMTDQEMGEIYAVAREALQGGQPAFQVQSFPFRMTAENFAKNRKNPNIGFWRNLKQGADTFEVTKQPVPVASCGGKYAFGGTGGCGLSTPDPSVVAAVTEKTRRDEERAASLAASGTPAVNIIYEDGGSNPVFAGRSVDTTAIPGRDRPYNKVLPPTVIALNDSGAPASEADRQAAARATYSAAETLLMAEAAVARRPVGPQSPTVVAKRQQAVYARLMGSTMPAPAEPKPAANPEPEVVVASAAPAEATASAPGQTAPSDEAPFYQRWLGFADEPSKPQAPVLTSAVAAVPAPATSPAQPLGKAQPGAPAPKPVLTAHAAEPVAASMGTAAPAAAEEQPFYQRYAHWLGLGSDAPAAPEAAPPTTASVPVDPVAVPQPPQRPRSAALKSGKPSPADLDTFTSLNY